ncbi:MAG: hypothetical protein IT180_08380 [Acidobacteria bacterium]|nr:hypothetical protein [Acidobacteriota bacterium]
MPELPAAVYDERRRVADRVMRLERPDHTLQPAARACLYREPTGALETDRPDRRDV